jgi:hypothetical protein
MREQSTRHFPPLWRVEQIDGGYVVKDAKGQSLAYVYGRETLEADADTAHVLTMDEARHIASNIAKLPTLLTLREASAFINVCHRGAGHHRNCLGRSLRQPIHC